MVSQRLEGENCDSHFDQSRAALLRVHHHRSTHHCDDLEVFQVRSLCGQNLFGNEVGLIGGISLRGKTDNSFNFRETDHTSSSSSTKKITILPQ